MRSRRMITVVGCHAGGEIGNVIVGGVLPPPGATMFEKMHTLEREGDALRRLLLREPRGSVAVPRQSRRARDARRTATPASSSWSRPSIRPCRARTRSAPRPCCSRRAWWRCASRRRRAARGAGGRRRGAGALPRRPVSRASSSRTCRASPTSSTRRSRSTASARSPSTSPTAACGTRSSTRAGSASRSSRTRRATCRCAGERIRAAAREQLPCAHPENPRSRASIVQIAEPWQGVGERHAERRRGRAGAPRPLGDRHRPLRAHGGAARARTDGASATR